MIITKKKDIKDILKHLKGEKAVFVMGCGECSTVCKTGGETEVAEMKKSLEREGLTVSGSCIPDAPCVITKLRSKLRESKNAIDDADSVLVLACGLGAQSVRDNLPEYKAVHIGCDTHFMGQVAKNNVMLETCSACGDCMLDLTDAICPVTKCAKGLMNGPCGGQDKGKCEVDPEKDCAWVLIYNGLKKKGKLHLLKEIRPPRSYAKALKPRQTKT